MREAKKEKETKKDKELMIQVADMTCINCENTIKRKLQKTKGISQVFVSYAKGQVHLWYDPAQVGQEDIYRKIEDLGYAVARSSQKKKTDWSRLWLLPAVFLLFILWKKSGVGEVFRFFPQVSQGMGYGMLFVIGLLTSFHCIAMCGGLNLTACMAGGSDRGEGKRAAAANALLYNSGRVLSYTFSGALAGLLGAAVQFSNEVQGALQLAAGMFMIIMGLNMLQVFPSLRYLQLHLPRGLGNLIYREKRRNSTRPFYIGLLNGLMPCGPLQGMQLYALSTGSPARGAFSMLLFSLGTVPVMLLVGVLSAYLSNRRQRKLLWAGALLILILGVNMMGNGFALAGIHLPYGKSNVQTNTAVAEGEWQTVTTTLSPGSYEEITVQEGLWVRWIIEAGEGSINGCNNRIFISEYGIKKSLEPGSNVIEFFPEEAGVYVYSCWMGMIRSTINVTAADR